MRKLAPSCKETARRIASGEMSCEEHVASRVERIPRMDRDVHAFLFVAKDAAVDAARNVDQRAKRGEKLGRLAGIGIAIKDNICVKGMPATCASRILEGFEPPYDATVTERLRGEDAIVLGKTNMDEFAMGNTTQSGAFGPTRNPWDITRVPGGSSGGSAAAVAAGMATLSLGTDTGGSVRCPASFCSIFGLKPTYGAVSRYGVIPYANSLEQVGPMARRVDDLELLFDVIRGKDPRDATSSAEASGATPHSRWNEIRARGVRGMKVGRIREFFGEGIHDGVKKRVLAASDTLEGLGASVGEVSISSLGYGLAAYYIIAMAEASSNLSRYDGVRYGASLERDATSTSSSPSADWNTSFAKTRTECFGVEVKRRILLGTFVLSAGYYEAYYLKAQGARRMMRREFERAFREFDILLGPTMPVLPPKVDEKPSPLEDYLIDVDTVPSNLVGVPSMSVPVGFVDGLPVGMQLMGPWFGEELLFTAARSLEEVLG